MRRLFVALAPFIAVVLASCEDGPQQTFQPAPSGAANAWNDGKTDPSVTGGTQSFDERYPTTGKTTLCSTDLKRQRWAWMLKQPIQPPRWYAGIDMAKDDYWHGLTIEDAEATPADPDKSGGGLCQSVPIGYIGGCPSGIGSCNTSYWGNNAEVIFTWNVTTHMVDQMELTLGYTGAMEFKSKDGTHSYVMKVGDVWKKDGQPFLIDWEGNPSPQVTELYNAAMATFAEKAGVIFEQDSEDCGEDGNCLIVNSQGTWIMGFRPLVVYFMGSSGVPQPALSTPQVLYNFFTKTEPYSYLPQVLKMDGEGPVAWGKPAGARAGTVCDTITDAGCCVQKIGVTFGEVKNKCVQVHGPAGNPDNVDVVNLNKIKFGLSHGLEYWTANVMGINQNFTSLLVSNTLFAPCNDPANDHCVVLDTDTPQDEDLAQDWTFDIRAKGQVINDYGLYGGARKLDLRGSAMVYIEWGRLMLQDIYRVLKAAGKPVDASGPRRLGDPACTGFDSSGKPKMGAGCSGIEGLIIPTMGRGDFTGDTNCPGINCLDPGNNWDSYGLFYGASILKPGDIHGAFCVDPGNFSDCTFSGQSPWVDAYNWVVRHLGNGLPENVPGELRDRRYYFKWFGVAFMKYLKAYSNFNAATRDEWPPTGLGPTAVKNQIIDMESIFYDNNESGGTNGFDKFEYVDRTVIGQGTPAKYNFVPWNFEYGCDIIGGNQRYDNFTRRLEREENVLYSAMLENKDDHTPLEENNVNATNLYGSDLVASIWPSYECAIGAAGNPATNGCGNPPPLDTTNMVSCASSTCPAGQECIYTPTMENGWGYFCGTPCNLTAYPTTGCAQPYQTCVLSMADGATMACLDMRLDLNGRLGLDGTGLHPRPAMSYYPSVWGRSVFSKGHSPIKLMAKHPGLGVAKISIPNYQGGPYVNSPQLATGVPATCPTNWTLDTSQTWCYAPQRTGTCNVGDAYCTKGSSWDFLVPWLEVQPGVGFEFPIDAMHDQAVITGHINFHGTYETYSFDYLPWVDTAKSSCVAGACNAGYTCNPSSKSCEAADGTIRIMAVETEDFLGEVFLCQDPMTGDILHVRQYDSALAILEWLAAHPGGWDGNHGTVQQGAQQACGIIVRYSPYNNYLDFITSKVWGVKIAINQGAGLGRVHDAMLYDSSVTQTP